MNEPATMIDLIQKATELSGSYQNVVVGRINDHVVRMSVMTEPYFWHLHPDSDEVFIGIEGTLVLDLEHQRIELGPGQMFSVPQGAKHRTSPAGGRSVNLTIERANITTVRVARPSI